MRSCDFQDEGVIGLLGPRASFTCSTVPPPELSIDPADSNGTWTGSYFSAGKPVLWGPAGRAGGWMGREGARVGGREHGIGERE